MNTKANKDESKLTPCQTLGYNKGDYFKVLGQSHPDSPLRSYFDTGEIVQLYNDDNSTSPDFINKFGVRQYVFIGLVEKVNYTPDQKFPNSPERGLE